MPTIQQKIKALDAEKVKLIAALDQQRGRKKFQCGCCHAMHAIKDCDVIQTHWYTSPSGCTGGDYWNDGELQIICPATDHKNRVHFSSYYAVDYSLRNAYAHSADAQFKRLYKHLFKSVIDDYDKDQRSWVNLNYFDEHRARFDLHIKGLDPEKKEHA